MSQNPQRAVTAADVARAAGVDRSTVSRVLNRSFSQHSYAEGTIQAVEEAAQRLGYRPSATARALRTGKSMLIGLLVGDIANPFFSELASHIEEGLSRAGYRVMIGNTRESESAQRTQLTDLIQRNVDGLILSPSGNSGIAVVTGANVPLVLVDRPLPEHELPFVGLDNRAAGLMLGRHLAALDYRRIAIVQPETDDDPTIDWRLAGLLDGLGSDAEIVWQHHQALEPNPRQLADAIAATGGTFEVLVGLTNACTITGLEALRITGLEVPGNVGLTGIDDFRAAPLLDPPLTLVAQPLREIAKASVDHLLWAIAGKPRPGSHLLSPHLIERRSLRHQSKP